MWKCLWYETLRTKRYNKRQQEILREIALLIEHRKPKPKPEKYPEQ